MRTIRSSLKLGAALLLAATAFTGCESTDGGGSQVSGGVYYGVGFYDPWYYGDYDDDLEISVTPPPKPDRPDAPPRPAHPIARPPISAAPAPRPMPSIPSSPRPMARPAMRR